MVDYARIPVLVKKSRSDVTASIKLTRALGPSFAIWQKLVDIVMQEYGPLQEVWKPSKREFGRICLLKSKKRTLLYLLPGASRFEVGVVLGERAVALALASDLPDFIKKLLAEARPYAEGRGIRFGISSPKQIALVVQLIGIKTTPK